MDFFDKRVLPKSHHSAVSVNFTVISQNHIILPNFVSFHGDAHTFMCLFQKLSSTAFKSKASQRKDHKINVFKYMKSMLFFSFILRNCGTTWIFFQKCFM